MKRNLPAITLLSGFFFFACEQQQTESAPPEPLQDYYIIGYLTGWKSWEIEDVAADRLTHINYAFVDIVDGEVVSYLPDDPENFAKLQRLREQHPHLKLLVSVGGWTHSKGFSDAALTETSRRRFAQSAVDFLRKYELDGVDLDWEYPAQIGDNNPFRPEDKQNFTLMLQELRRQLNQASGEDDRGADPYLLTIATGANQNYLNHTEMDKAQQYLDFINIMTYDYAGGWIDTTAHHANLYPSTTGKGSAIDSEKGVAQHVAAGIPLEKIVLGVPFYGRSWEEVDTTDRGLHQPAAGAARSYAYHTLVDSMIGQRGFERHWDPDARSPYLWNPESHTFVTFEDTASIRLKAEFVKARGMAGVMFWEYNSDTTGTLLKTLYRELKAH